MQVSDFVAIGSLSLAVVTTSAGALLWYIQGEKKKYASERDFQHLKRNQEQISQGIESLAEDIDHKLEIISRDILEIKMALGIKRNNECG